MLTRSTLAARPGVSADNSPAVRQAYGRVRRRDL